MTKSINLCNLPRFIDTGNKGKINWKESVGIIDNNTCCNYEEQEAY